MKKYLILTLFIFSLISLSVASSYSFFSGKTTSQGTITLKELDFTVVGEDKEVLDIMPGDIIDIEYQIINARDKNGTDTDNLADIYMRFNLTLLANDPINMQLTMNNAEDFQLINDMYYYLKPLKVSNIETLFNGFKINEEIDNSFQNQPISFMLTVEAIQSTQEALQELWPELYNILY